MRLTNGGVAMVNLQSQIDGMQRKLSTADAALRDSTELVELVALRGQILGRIGDFEWAETMAEKLTQVAPAEGDAFMARARTRSRFHRFSDALADLDLAEHLGADCAKLDAERASIFQAIGRYEEADTLYTNVAKRRTDFDSLGALAVLTAERGETADAEALFDESLALHRGVSPFGPALLDFQRAHMWASQGDLRRARTWFEAAVALLPAYAPAQGHLAEIEAELGERDAAVSRLLPLAGASDDPDYAASLARLLKGAGQVRDADKWRSVAAARYDELMARHPEAFADHAAAFWLEAGDAGRAAGPAKMNLEVRNTPRARELFARTFAGVGVTRP